MIKIRYYDGKSNIEILVSEKLAQAYHEIEREEWRKEKRKKRHESISLDELLEAGVQFADNINIELHIFEMEKHNERKQKLLVLKDAFAQLKPEQLKLIKMIFVENKSYTEIGREIGVTKQAIHQRLERILAQLKNFF